MSSFAKRRASQQSLSILNATKRLKIQGGKDEIFLAGILLLPHVALCYLIVALCCFMLRHCRLIVADYRIYVACCRILSHLRFIMLPCIEKYKDVAKVRNEVNDFTLLPSAGAGRSTREATRRLWALELAAKHSKSFCRLIPCLSYPYL
jgi:hypothetical protein